MEKIKLIYFANIPSPYRVEFFNKLAESIDLTVVFDSRKDKMRNDKWFEQTANKYKEIYLTDENVKLKDILKTIKSQYDLVIVGGYSTRSGIYIIRYLNSKKIPFIINADGGFIGNDNIIKKIIKKYLISSAKYWLSTSKGTTDYLEHYGAKKDNVYEYRFTTLKEDEILKENIEYSKKRELRKQYGLDYDILYISVGQFIHRKGYDVLIESVDILNKNNDNKNYGVVVIGGGEEEQNYKNNIESLGINNIHFIDFMNKQELMKYYDMSDIFVTPTREDIWGLVINEALGRGIPIISTDKCLAAMELVQNGKNGYIVNVDDVQDLASKIQEVNNKTIEELDDMSKEALNSIREYTIENMVKDHIEILEKIKNN